MINLFLFKNSKKNLLEILNLLDGKRNLAIKKKNDIFNNKKKIMVINRKNYFLYCTLNEKIMLYYDDF